MILFSGWNNCKKSRKMARKHNHQLGRAEIFHKEWHSISSRIKGVLAKRDTWSNDVVPYVISISRQFYFFISIFLTLFVSKYYYCNNSKWFIIKLFFIFHILNIFLYYLYFSLFIFRTIFSNFYFIVFVVEL